MLFKFTIYFILSLIPYACSAVDLLSYRQDDWVTFRNYRFIRCADADTRNAYIGTNRGMLIFDLWKNQWLNPVTISDGLKSADILDIRSEEARNRVWIKTTAGIGYYDLASERWDYNPWKNPFLKPVPSKRLKLTNLFIPPPYFFDGRTVKDAAFTPFQITAAIKTGSENFIIGTWGLGTGYGSLRMNKAEMHPFGLWNDEVSCILRDKQNIWFGSAHQGGLTKFNTSSLKWEYFYYPVVSSMRDSRITALFSSL